MLEEVIRLESEKAPVVETNHSNEFMQLSNKISNIAESLDNILSRLSQLEAHVPSETVHVTRMDNDMHTSSKPVNLYNFFTNTTPGLEIHLKNEVTDVVNLSRIDHEDEEEEILAEEEAKEEEVEEEAKEEAEEEEAKEEEAEEEDAEEEVEEVEEEVEEEDVLEEFVYKNKTYYKDTSNVLYTLSADGEPVAVGKFNPDTQRVSRL
jgi:nucleotide-binding universal stress UspA family protein